jgi:hypothetical protein
MELLLEARGTQLLILREPTLGGNPGRFGSDVLGFPRLIFVA